MNNRETIDGVVRLHFDRDDVERLLRAEAMKELNLKSGEQLRVILTSDVVYNSTVEIEESALK
jgi:hypothetical protein